MQATMKECLSKRYARSPDVVSRTIGGETILVPISRSVAEVGAIYTLNEVAARVWSLADGRRTVAEILDAVTGEFEVTPQEAERDLGEFLLQLERIGAVKES